MLGALQSAFREPAFLRQGGDALMPLLCIETIKEGGGWSLVSLSVGGWVNKSKKLTFIQSVSQSFIHSFQHYLTKVAYIIGDPQAAKFGGWDQVAISANMLALMCAPH
jgi:hypothetical protein